VAILMWFWIRSSRRGLNDDKDISGTLLRGELRGWLCIRATASAVPPHIGLYQGTASAVPQHVAIQRL